MKNNIFILFLFLFSFSSFAGVYTPEKDLNNCDNKFAFKKDCEKKTGLECFKLDHYECGQDYNLKKEKMIADLENPIWSSRSIIESCSGEDDCKAKSALKECVDGRQSFYNKEYSEMWCMKIIGYNEKGSGEFEIVQDAEKKALYEAKKLAKKKESDLIGSKLQDMEFGKKLYAFVQVVNRGKGLTKAQRRQLRKDLKEIRDDLFDGNICEAKTDIQALVTDGVIIKDSDIQGIVAKINEYKTCE